MNILTIINAIANMTTAISAIALLIHIFGDPKNPIWNNNIKAYLAKTGLTVMICGAVANILTLSTPVKTEILLNCGMSITFFWLSWWQYEQFKKSSLITIIHPVEAPVEVAPVVEKVEPVVEVKKKRATTKTSTKSSTKSKY
jgi:hypothetical protein